MTQDNKENPDNKLLQQNSEEIDKIDETFSSDDLYGENVSLPDDLAEDTMSLPDDLYGENISLPDDLSENTMSLPVFLYNVKVTPEFMMLPSQEVLHGESIPFPDDFSINENDEVVSTPSQEGDSWLERIFSQDYSTEVELIKRIKNETANLYETSSDEMSEERVPSPENNDLMNAMGVAQLPEGESKKRPRSKSDLGEESSLKKPRKRSFSIS